MVINGVILAFITVLPQTELRGMLGGLSVAVVSPAKTAEPTEIPFAL